MSILHKPSHDDPVIGIMLKIDFGDKVGEYGFEINTDAEKGYEVSREKCVLKDREGRGMSFETRKGKVISYSGLDSFEAPGVDRFVLPLLDDFSIVYEFITNIEYYSILPSEMPKGSVIDKESEVRLLGDGKNYDSILYNISKTNKTVFNELCDTFAMILPVMIKPTIYKAIPEDDEYSEETLLLFDQYYDETMKAKFLVSNLSEGTLRVLGILSAIYQVDRPSVTIIEHPEDTIHPAALEILVDVLKAGTDTSQIIVTTHSPVILEDKDIKDDEIICVINEGGVSYASGVDEVTRGIIRDGLTTAGELLKTGELGVDREPLEREYGEDFLFTGMDD
jgi:predicted ATPase